MGWVQITIRKKLNTAQHGPLLRWQLINLAKPRAAAAAAGAPAAAAPAAADGGQRQESAPAAQHPGSEGSRPPPLAPFALARTPAGAGRQVQAGAGRQVQESAGRESAGRG